ncbi:DUF6498-containing protein [Salinigranum marinum]|uniref:DUF6498-containing protein n=1 Tax=Salinigranum marinum TaxID=1515595 RepID=UPI002989B78D|nr:DUF6498-containing protein [Salinigranum marinum]
MLRSAETEIAERLGIPRNYLSPIGMHLLLTIGILFLEWDVVELTFIYFSEIVVVAVLFAIVALFAAQPVEDHDADKWREDPSPVQLVPLLPPIYPRNIGLIVDNMFTYAVFFLFFVVMFISIVDRSVSSLLSPTAGLVIVAICVSQLLRVWREFLVDHSYRDRSPAEALELGLRPVAKFIIIVVYVIVPTTVVVLTAAFAFPDTVSGSVVLLAYVLPIGVARVWLQDDAVEAVLQHQE